MENFSSNHKSYRQPNGLQQECPDSRIPALLVTFSLRESAVWTRRSGTSHVAGPSNFRTGQEYSTCFAADHIFSGALSALQGGGNTRPHSWKQLLCIQSPQYFFGKREGQTSNLEFFVTWLVCYQGHQRKSNHLKPVSLRL